MKKTAIIVMGLLLFSAPMMAKGKHRAHAKSKLVTATGCISQGTECLLLSAPNGGRKLYSITKSEKLQVGHAYRITGRKGEIGFCMEGVPILTPVKITEVKLHCS